MSLTTKQKRYLRGLSHKLQAVVTIANNGLSENVINELDDALNKHELIKVKLRSDKQQRRQWIEEIGSKFNAEQIHVIGQVACFFKRNPENPVIVLPGKG
jgi:RNA-binding protein